LDLKNAFLTAGKYNGEKLRCLGGKQYLRASKSVQRVFFHVLEVQVHQSVSRIH